MQIDKEALHDAVESAAEKLPEGWEIVISVEQWAGSVDLFDEWGDKHDYPSNHECMADSVRDALEYALEEEAKTNGRD